MHASFALRSYPFIRATASKITSHIRNCWFAYCKHNALRVRVVANTQVASDELGKHREFDRRAGPKQQGVFATPHCT